MGEEKEQFQGAFTPNLGVDKSFSGEYAVRTAGENVSFGETGYVKSDGKVWKGDADQVGTMPVFYICVAKNGIAADATGNFGLRCYVRNDAWNWDVGSDTPGLLYQDEGTGGTVGGMIQTPPAGAGDQAQVLGQAETADVILWDPDKTLVEI